MKYKIRNTGVTLLHLTFSDLASQEISIHAHKDSTKLSLLNIYDRIFSLDIHDYMFMVGDIPNYILTGKL